MMRLFHSARGTLIKSLQNRSLKQTIKDRIIKNGPISFADYMEMSLFDPDFGYYNNGEIFGKQGDFITSPEVSQVFGELLAVWCAMIHNSLKNPAKWHLVEIGPGRGTLAADMLRTLKGLKLHTGLSMHLIDLSNHLKEQQKQNIVSASGGSLQYEKFKGIDRYFDKDFSAYWYSSLPQMTQSYMQEYQGQPVVVIGHEIFDALPVHIFEFSSKQGWCERVVDLNDLDQFELVLTEGPNQNVKNILNPQKLFPSTKLHTIQEGDRLEISPASHKLTQDICSILKLAPSCSLLIDYGDERAFSDSIRGIKNHEKITAEKWLEMPGEVDLSAYVDFAAIKTVALGFPEIQSSKVVPQGFFLEALGISDRFEILAQKNPAKREKLMSEYERLASPEYMGEIYKVLFLGNKSLGEVFPFGEDLVYEKAEQ